MKRTATTYEIPLEQRLDWQKVSAQSGAAPGSALPVLVALVLFGSTVSAALLLFFRMM